MPAVKDRLFRSQLTFLKSEGREAAVSDTALAEPINRLARSFSIPAYSKANDKQVRALRALWRRLAPTLLGPSQGEQMSPAGAVLLCLALIQQKITNPFFEQDSNHFLDAIEKLKHSSDTTVRVEIIAAKLSGTARSKYEFIKQLSLRLETSSGAKNAVNKFFDELGMDASPL